MTESARRQYIRRADRPVAAVRLSLDTEGLVYQKWGHAQRAKPGDWLVDNDGDVYSVDAEAFARTYRPVAERGPGAYVKVTPIWAERAQGAGHVKTQEGATEYGAGDYIVSNNRDGSDAYAISARKFEDMYEPAPEHGDDRR
jgi:hypothetical protein